MATATFTTGARARFTTPGAVALAARRGVTIFDGPEEPDPDCRAFVIAGIRCFEIRTSPAGFSARWHQRDGVWFPLAPDGSFNEAAAAIGRFLDLVEHLPVGWSREADDTEVGAAVEVLAAVPALPLAA